MDPEAKISWSKTVALLQGQYDDQVREGLRHDGDDPTRPRLLWRSDLRWQDGKEKETGGFIADYFANF